MVLPAISAGTTEITYLTSASCSSTVLIEVFDNPDVIEMQLAHAPKDRIRAVYNKAEYMPERTKMMQEWADYLDKLKNET